MFTVTRKESAVGRGRMDQIPQSDVDVFSEVSFGVWRYVCEGYGPIWGIAMVIEVLEPGLEDVSFVGVAVSCGEFGAANR